MHAHQRPSPYQYNTSPYGIPAYGTVTYQSAPLDTNWHNTWPTIKSILLAVTLLICATAIISLDIANLAIEANKQNGTSTLGMGTGKVGAGVWSGTVSLFAACVILAIIFIRNKRVAATFALIAVTLAFLFAIVLVGLVGNTIQNNLHDTYRTDAEKTQNKLLIAIIAIALFIMVLCMTFFVMYIRIFFSPSTRQSTTHRQ